MGTHLGGEVGVEGINGDLQDEQEGDLRRRHLPEHCPEADHRRTGRKRRIDQQRQVQLNVRPDQATQTF